MITNLSISLMSVLAAFEQRKKKGQKQRFRTNVELCHFTKHTHTYTHTQTTKPAVARIGVGEQAKVRPVQPLGVLFHKLRRQKIVTYIQCNYHHSRLCFKRNTTLYSITSNRTTKPTLHLERGLGCGTVALAMSWRGSCGHSHPRVPTQLHLDGAIGAF